MGQKQAMVCKLSVFMVSARLLVVIAVATPPWGVASDPALRRPVEDMYNEVSATHPELKPIPAQWLAEERNLRREEIALRDLTPLEEQFDGSLLCDEDVQALNSLASTLFPVGLTEAVAMAAFGLLHTTPHLYRMMWVCESRMYVNVVAVFHAMVSHVAVQLLQRMIKYDAESSAGLDTKLQDNFAARFCKELCDRVLLQSLSVPQAFHDSCSLFTSARNGSQFQIGDPATYLHTGTQREHAYDPECVGCKPPVHGVYELLTLDPATRRIARNESHASSSTSTTALNN